MTSSSILSTPRSELKSTSRPLLMHTDPSSWPPAHDLPHSMVPLGSATSKIKIRQEAEEGSFPPIAFLCFWQSWLEAKVYTELTERVLGRRLLLSVKSVGTVSVSDCTIEQISQTPGGKDIQKCSRSVEREMPQILFETVSSRSYPVGNAHTLLCTGCDVLILFSKSLPWGAWVAQ